MTQTLNIVFSRRKTFLSWITRKFLGSRWSHVTVMLPDEPGLCIEAVLGKGVVVSPVYDPKSDVRKHAEYQVVSFPVDNPDLVISIMKAELGKPYDLLGAVGIGLRRGWQKNDAWFCSELIAYAFDKAGFPLFRSEAMHRISPENLWRIPNSIMESRVY